MGSIQRASAKLRGMGKGFIEGLRLVYVSANALTVQAGSAYVPSLNKAVELGTDKALTGLSLTAATFYHFYLYENAGVGDIEMSTTAPVRVSGSAFQKTGDSSRRYIGSALAGASNTLQKFIHYPSTGQMYYLVANAGVAPFIVLAGGTTTTTYDIDPAAAIPVTAHTACTSVSAGSAAVVFGNVDQVNALAGPNWLSSVSASVIAKLDIPIGSNGRFQAKNTATSTGGVTVYILGYFFER